MASSHRGDAMPPTRVSGRGPGHPGGAPKVQELAVIRRFRAWRARHTLLIDALVALAVLAPGVVMSARGDISWILAVAVHVLLVAPLVWRRRQPMLVLGLVAAAEVVALALQVQNGGFAVAVATYTVIVHDRARNGLLAVAVLVGCTVARELVWPSFGTLLERIVSLLLLNAMVVLLAFAVRTRRAHLAALEERAARLEVERDQQAQLAAAGERARIAREMHDIVAHNLAMMISLADGATAAMRDQPDRARVALTALASTGRGALDELRRVLGVLREDRTAGAAGAASTEGVAAAADRSDADRAPQPVLADLELLVDRIRAAGLPVEFTVSGQVQRLPESAQLAVYRVVQESLTNAMKHGGPGASAGVRVAFTSSGVDLTVTNTGESASEPGSGGHGLVGMRERVAVYGGEVAAGPRTGGGWSVHATIPTGHSAVGLPDARTGPARTAPDPERRR